MDLQGFSSESSQISTHPSSQLIPVMIREKAVHLLATDVIIDTADKSEIVVTIFMGIVDKDFSNDDWNNNLQKIKSLFNIDINNYEEVKIFVNPINERQVNSERLATEMKKVLDKLNRTTIPIKCLRIVHLSPAYSQSYDISVESIIRGWIVPLDKKNIQLVVVSESDDCHWFEFLRLICLQNICNSAQFFNATDYNQYGFLDNRRSIIKATVKEGLRKRPIQEDDDDEKKFQDDLQKALLMSSSQSLTANNSQRPSTSNESRASASGCSKEKQAKDKDDCKKKRKETD